jgi:hypothetical protein
MMDRRVREHDPELPMVGRDARQGNARRRENDRPGHRGEKSFGVLVQLHERSGDGEVSGHDRERPRLAMLAGPQRRDSAWVSGIATQVIAAHPFDCDD